LRFCLSVATKDALELWFTDCQARGLSSESLRKYKRFKGCWGDKHVRAISLDDVRKLRESWTHAPGTQAKMLALLRSFFSFCEASGWMEKNPAKSVKAPQANTNPTLPYSDAEWKDILTALDVYADIDNFDFSVVKSMKITQQTVTGSNAVGAAAASTSSRVRVNEH
jgi:hypothetical protein